MSSLERVEDAISVEQTNEQRAEVWRVIARDLAWSQSGQPHTPEEQRALDAYDRAVAAEQVQ